MGLHRIAVVHKSRLRRHRDHVPGLFFLSQPGRPEITSWQQPTFRRSADTFGSGFACKYRVGIHSDGVALVLFPGERSYAVSYCGRNQDTYRHPFVVLALYLKKKFGSARLAIRSFNSFIFYQGPRQQCLDLAI